MLRAMSKARQSCVVLGAVLGVILALLLATAAWGADEWSLIEVTAAWEAPLGQESTTPPGPRTQRVIERGLDGTNCEHLRQRRVKSAQQVGAEATTSYSTERGATWVYNLPGVTKFVLREYECAKGGAAK